VFRIRISAATEDIPHGYLFLCPAEDFRTKPSSFRWPDCPAYWSLDRLGFERLSTEDATGFGFPSIQLSVKVGGQHWDASVYTGLRQFHQGKGFDPDSQDLARHLGYLLYQISAEVDPLFSYSERTLPQQSIVLFLTNNK
jgi:hypothetical protein